MLSFATEFPIKHSRRAPAFGKALRKWLTGSPHTALTAKDLTDFARDGEWETSKGTERLETLSVATADHESVAMRYTRADSGLEWVTTVGFSRDATDTWVGVRVSCESTHPSVRLPPAKKPVLVKTILTELGGGADGLLPVGDAPLRLHDLDVDRAARLIVVKRVAGFRWCTSARAFSGSTWSTRTDSPQT